MGARSDRRRHGERRSRGAKGGLLGWAKRHPARAAALGGGLGVAVAALLRRRPELSAEAPPRLILRAMDAAGPRGVPGAERIVRRTMSYAQAGAADAGECLDIRASVDGRDADAWMAAWSEAAARADTQGDAALEAGSTVDARRAYWRACSSYRAAQAGCPPAHPRFHPLWMAGVTAFRKAAALFDPPIRPLEVPFEGRALPGYFWRPDASARRRPTLVVAPSSDESIEEQVFLIGSAAVERGYNFFTVSYPGHRSALHDDEALTARPDVEAPFAAALDVLEALPGVDERIALMGFGGGGYVAPRVAIHDERVQAVVAVDPVVDYARLADAVVGPLVERLPQRDLEWLIRRRSRRDAPLDASLAHGLLAQGYGHAPLHEWLTSAEAQRAWAPFAFGDDLPALTCPLLILVGSAQPEELQAQARELHAGALSSVKRLHVVGPERHGSPTGGVLDDLSRLHQLTFGWLRGVMPPAEKRVVA